MFINFFATWNIESYISTCTMFHDNIYLSYNFFNKKMKAYRIVDFSKFRRLQKKSQLMSFLIDLGLMS